MKAMVTIFPLLLTTLLPGQNPSISAALDANKIKLGEQVVLALEARFNAQDTLMWPHLKDTITSKLEIVQLSKIDTSFERDNITTKILRQSITLTSFDSGFHALPPLPFIFNNDTLYTEALLLGVQTVEVDTSKAIYDIKQPIKVELTWQEWLQENWLWIAGGLAVAGLSLLLFYWFRNRKLKPMELKPVLPDRKPHEIALEKLNKLKNDKLWQSGRVKQYHTMLSEIMREYLELRFKIHALEQTTYEIRQYLKTVAMEDEMKAGIERLLVLSDLVKFAKEQPLPGENEQSLESAYFFIANTIPAEETEKKETTDVVPADA